MWNRILAILLLFVGIASAGEPLDSVLARFAKVGLFAFGGVGYAGITSRGEKDYRLIFSRTTAEADFERLFAVGNAQARAYALVGIHTLDPKRFKQISQPYRDSSEDITTQRGCIVMHESFRAVLKRIETNEFSLYSRIPPASSEPGIAP